MFIGHLPAGYVLTKKIQTTVQTNNYLLLGMIASILPDIDMLYFYFIDNQQHLHHGYWIHTPFYWMVIAAVTFFAIWIFQKREYHLAAGIFFANIFLHLILDTVVGKIEWLYPFTEHAYSFFEVPAIYDYWVYNFIFHWTFLFEVAVVVWAVYLLFGEKKEENLSKRT